MSLAHVHPMLVHFPIALAVLALLFDGWALLNARVDMDRAVRLQTGTIVLAIGAAFAIAAYAFGDWAYDIARWHGVEGSLLETHEELGTASAAVFVAVALARILMWRRAADHATRGKVACIAMSASLTGLLLVTAYFGGHLVYDLGVNVAAHG